MKYKWSLNFGNKKRGSWNSQYCWTRETCPLKTGPPEPQHRCTLDVFGVLVVLSSWDTGHPLLAVALSFTWVQRILSIICKDVHLILGWCSHCSVRWRNFTLWQPQSLSFELWARSKSLLAAEHPFLYLKSKDSIAVRFVTRTGVLFIDSRALGWR